MLKCTSKNNDLYRLKEFAKSAAHADIDLKYDSLFGVNNHFGSLISANFGELQRLQMELVERVDDACDGEVFHRELVVGVTPGSCIDLNIKQARAQGCKLHSRGEDWLGLINPVIAPSAADPLGFGLMCKVETIAFGAHQSSAYPPPTRARKNRGTAPRVETARVGAGDDLAELIDRMLWPQFRVTAATIEAATDLGDFDWSKKKNARLRGLLLLFTLALLPLQYRFIGGGAGKAIIGGAIASAQLRWKEARRELGEPLIHRDAVVQFLASELKRLGLTNVDVPIVRLR